MADQPPIKPHIDHQTTTYTGTTCDVCGVQVAVVSQAKHDAWHNRFEAQQT